MKTLQNFLLLVLLTGIFMACSKDDAQTAEEEAVSNFAARESSCDTQVGYAGAYYDFANARPVAWPEFPVIDNPGEQFIHSQLPLLGFILPQGFQAFEISDGATNAIGVDIVSLDEQVYFRWLPNSFFPGQTIAANDILQGQIRNIKTFYGFDPDTQGTEICGESREQVFETIPMQFSISLFRVGDRLAQAWVLTTYAAGGTAVTVSFNTAPEADYANQVAETFLPLNFQLYVKDNGDIVDQDGDGFTVLEDPDDTDENVPVNQGG